ncbi:MAG: aminotransferase class V-fold PLP-dependent enzyme, partial [Acidobacteria bacterium]|nr:aminotransferase class V-fold PLP-dependent enzyme [Acidobacteriota bacterium]
MNDTRVKPGGWSRRDFARLLGLAGPAAFLGRGAELRAAAPAPLTAARSATDEAYWRGVRAQFVMPPKLAVMNAANLCPSSGPVLDKLYETTKDVDRDPSQNNRQKFSTTRENTRKALAAFLKVTPEEIVITRNTSEANNIVSSGLPLKEGDEVVIYSDNHPSNNAAWLDKAKRYGFSVKVVEQKNPHPGPEYYIKAFTEQLTPKTRLLSLTHLTNTVGDLLPVKELCRIARERGVLSLVDGAQTFGLLDVDLSVMQPDFYTGSGHKWPCGPRETGVLFVNKNVSAKVWASIISAGAGPIGISHTLESMGQRDDAAIVAFGDALQFQNTIGRAMIEQRSRHLAQALMEGLRKLNGVQVWTSTDPARSAAVVSFRPASLDARKLNAALYEKDQIACATRGGTDRSGLRFSPHIYNTMEEVDRTIAAIKR